MKLISRIVSAARIHDAVTRGLVINSLLNSVELEDFATAEARAIYSQLSSMRDIPAFKGSYHTPETLRDLVFPMFVCDDNDQSITNEALVKYVKDDRVRRDLQNAAKLALERVSRSQPDYVGIVNELQATCTHIQNRCISKETDVPFDASYGRSMGRIRALDAGWDMSCGKWPWHPLQKATGGLQPDDYMVLYGRPKNMKTWVLSYLLSHFYEQGKSMLIYTKEMTADNIFRRAGACLARVEYQYMRLGGAPKDVMETLELVGRMLQLRQKTQPVWALSANNAPDGADTVPWLESKVEKYKPDLVFIDGMYLLSDVKKAVKDNDRVRNISRAIRAMILKTRVPVIATIQANRAAAKNQEANTDEIAFSDALGQDTTLLMRCIKEKDQPTIALVVGGVTREFDLEGFRINAQPAVNFEYHSEISLKEIEKAKERDAGDSENGNHKVAAARAKKITNGQVLTVGMDRMASTMGLFRVP